MTTRRSFIAVVAGACAGLLGRRKREEEVEYVVKLNVAELSSLVECVPYHEVIYDDAAEDVFASAFAELPLVVERTSEAPQ